MVNTRQEAFDAVSACLYPPAGTRSVGGAAHALNFAANPTDFADARQYVVPPGCRRGGDLDLRIEGSHFP